MSDRGTDNQGKMKALELAVTQIEKQFGKGSIMKLGSGDVSDDVQVVSTGSLSLDLALGVGGLPRGRVVEIFGPESSGKTTLCLHVIAETQKIGGSAAFIDAEHALDVSYAKKLGVRSDDSAGGPTGHRGTSPGDYRDVGQKRGHRPGGRGLRRRLGAPC